MPKLRELARSASDSACHMFNDSQFRLETLVAENSPPMQAFLQLAAENVNGRLGMSRQDWIQITRIAVRMLLPFIAALFSIVVFPPKVVEVIFLPTVASVLFVSAFYGIQEEDPCQDHSRLSLSRIPKPSSVDFSGKEEEL